MKNTLIGLTLLVCFVSAFTFGQKTTVQVLDNGTSEPIAFTKILAAAPAGGQGETKAVLTDIDGKASFKLVPSRKYTFRFFSYRDTTILGSQLLKDSIVLLRPDAQMYEEVVIVPGENPAHRIIQNAMDHKKENNPRKNNSFQYNSYSKLYLTGEIDEDVKRDTITDSTTIELMNFIDRQYFFLVETKAKRIFNPPSYDKEVVTSYNVSGVKDPLFATIVNQFQTFSFYDNQFKLNNQEYINPIAPGGLRRYLFILKDTIFHPSTQDTTYTISFRPRKGKNFEGLEGFLYIHTNGWAIERVIASPYEQDGLLDATIIQEYAILNDTKWFPTKISTELDFQSVQLGNYSKPIGRSSVYISDVVFDKVDKKGFNPVKVEVETGALKDSSAFEDVRKTSATGKEGNTYQLIDSIAEETNLERTFNLLKIASTGNIPIGFLSLPIEKITNFNRQEGIRLGLGVETNSELSRVVKVGGYFAYGIRDKKWKWGGDLGVTFNQKRQLKINLHYSDDVMERGGTDMSKDKFNLVNQSMFRNFYVSRLDRQRKAEIKLSGLIKQNIKLKLLGNYQRFTFTDNYEFLPLLSQDGTIDQFDVAEVGFKLDWNIRERIIILEDRRVSIGTKWPKLSLKGIRGIKGVFGTSQYDYYRLKFTAHQDFSIRGLGQLRLVSVNGATIGNVPLTLQQIQRGTGSSWNLSVSTSFQTMEPAEFFSDRHSSLFVLFNFLPFKNNTTWTEPQIAIHSAAGIGFMANKTDHKKINFKTPEKGYYESGILVNNIFKSGFVGVGLGAFYRYGPYHRQALEDNFVYKISVKFNI